MKIARFAISVRQSLACTLLALACGCTALPDTRADEMLAVCRAQEAAWNRHDVEAFMAEGYWNSPQLTFFSGGTDTRGFDATLERYRKRYTQGGNEMGALSFTELEAVPLAKDAGLVRGRWKLEFKDKPAVAGLFTLAMRKQAAGWRIVHDHTSVGE